MATLQPIRCVDDCGNVSARVDHAPALLLHREADSLVLLSATAARLQRLIHGLDVYVMNSSDDDIASFDPGSMHNALIALDHRCSEAHQIILGTLAKIVEERGGVMLPTQFAYKIIDSKFRNSHSLCEGWEFAAGLD